jgi:DNA replication and repair protein RecF
MHIAKLRLKSFRNFDEKEFDFSKGTTVVVGQNATGKTNLLESIYLLALGKSFKARLEEEMVSYGEQISRVKGRIMSDDDFKADLEVMLTRGEISIGETVKKTEKVARKKLYLNGISKRLIDFAGNLKITLFGPWDLDLVTESPSVRRKYLDTVLSLVDREYRRASLSYEKGLRQRNKLLQRIRDEGVSRTQLLFWDRLLIKNGDYISTSREGFFEYINKTPDFNGNDFILDYDKSAISESRLAQYKDEEVYAATTLVGPHRDDFIFNIKNKNYGDGKKRDLSKYGSRGEQRMSVFWLKLAELGFIEEKTQEKPVLLLDDIFSELDHKHKEMVFKLLKGQQTIITTADPHHIEKLKKVERIDL